jgi:hypothetical protein
MKNVEEKLKRIHLTNEERAKLNGLTCSDKIALVNVLDVILGDFSIADPLARSSGVMVREMRRIKAKLSLQVDAELE